MGKASGGKKKEHLLLPFALLGFVSASYYGEIASNPSAFKEKNDDPLGVILLGLTSRCG